MQGKGRLAFGVTSVVAAAAIASSADAGVVTLSKIVTNTRSTAQTYDFEATITSPASMSHAGILGSISVVVTDFNRNGVTLASTSAGDLYSAYIRGSRVMRFVPELPNVVPGTFQLQAAANGQATYSGGFGNTLVPVASNTFVTSGDELRVRMQFTLSAGDQAAITASFQVVETDPVPAPGTAVLLMLGAAFSRRRRSGNI